ncbi:hypothetical protein IWX90DRAFT_489624 [Phyllosticta citrichinensis]|uniref:BZIP domain-containing protein n=1 Tax=Phyllosticta citrichinensis TaxID=1130410 RepID=A0ABR1XJV8_9PEZI
MSQISILSLFELDGCLPGVPNLGQEIPRLHDGASIDDDFALFINWDLDLPRECPGESQEHFADFVQQSINQKASGRRDQWRIRQTSELGTVHRLQLDHIDTQQKDHQLNQPHDLLERSPPASAWSEDIGPSAKHWEDALRMIETLQRESSWPAQVEDIQQVVEAEDKRRRNNAASARFRVKKKQREEELTKKVRGLKEKANELEARITLLEDENKGLRKMVLFMKEQ